MRTGKRGQLTQQRLHAADLVCLALACCAATALDERAQVLELGAALELARVVERQLQRLVEQF